MTIIRTVELASAGNGVSLAAEPAGNVENPILVTKSLLAGPGIKISADDSFVGVTISATGMPAWTSLVTTTVHWMNGNTTLNHLVFTAAFPLIVTSIIGRVEVASSTPGTLSLVKASNGVALAAGLPLVQTPISVAGTAYTNQLLPLVTDISALRLVAGDTIGIQTTGTWTGGSGGLTIYMAPFNSLY